MKTEQDILSPRSGGGAVRRVFPIRKASPPRAHLGTVFVQDDPNAMIFLARRAGERARPRALFSAPSRKTRTHRKVSIVRASTARVPLAARARPATPGAGVLPNKGVRSVARTVSRCTRPAV
jgi:hypothetical protein